MSHLFSNTLIQSFISIFFPEVPPSAKAGGPKCIPCFFFFPEDPVEADEGYYSPAQPEGADAPLTQHPKALHWGGVRQTPEGPCVADCAFWRKNVWFFLWICESKINLLVFVETSQIFGMIPSFKNLKKMCEAAPFLHEIRRTYIKCISGPHTPSSHWKRANFGYVHIHSAPSPHACKFWKSCAPWAVASFKKAAVTASSLQVRKLCRATVAFTTQSTLSGVKLMALW